jgi:hypothetical protein
MGAAISSARKSRGRPPVGATPVNVRFPPDELEALDAWIADHEDAPTRPEAIRQLIAKAVGALGDRVERARNLNVKARKKKNSARSLRLATIAAEAESDRDALKEGRRPTFMRLKKKTK